MSKFNPYKPQVKFMSAANNCINWALDHPDKHADFFVYRSVNGEVKKYQLTHISLSLPSGDLQVMYQKSDDVADVVCERASEQDLKLISARAQQLAAAARAARNAK